MRFEFGLHLDIFDLHKTPCVTASRENLQRIMESAYTPQSNFAANRRSLSTQIFQKSNSGLVWENLAPFEFILCESVLMEISSVDRFFGVYFSRFFRVSHERYNSSFLSQGKILSSINKYILVTSYVRYVSPWCSQVNQCNVQSDR